MLRRCVNIFSVWCFITCALLIALSVWSYYMAYDVRGRIHGEPFAAVVMQGRVMLVVSSGAGWTWDFDRHTVRESMGFPPELKRPAIPGIGWDRPMFGAFRMLVPLWLVALVVGTPTVLLRVRRPWQFTLRSLFAAMTLLAVLLAMVVRLK